ncbi:MAG: ribonuclease HII, partial [Burkholderiales bacterium]
MASEPFKHLICGVDEAGRGPLAGPVFAAAVILDPQYPIVGIKDSKLLSAGARKALAESIRRHALAWALGRADVMEIETLNILQASLLAMQRAVEALALVPQLVLVDGLHCPK